MKAFGNGGYNPDDFEPAKTLDQINREIADKIKAEDRGKHDPFRFRQP
jgi:hypothetical protein